VLSADEIEIIVNICNDLVAAKGHCSDILAHDDDLAAQVAREFAERAGRIVPAHQLITVLTALRKRGRLDGASPVDAVDSDEDIGFDDMDEAAGQ
jgi:hypothetical protein